MLLGLDRLFTTDSVEKVGSAPNGSVGAGRHRRIIFRFADLATLEVTACSVRRRIFSAGNVGGVGKSEVGLFQHNRR